MNEKSEQVLNGQESHTEIEAITEVDVVEDEAKPEQIEQTAAEQTEPQELCEEGEIPASLCDIKSRLSHVDEKVISIEASTSKTKDEVHQLHKLYHNEYAGRLRKVESELAHYQNIEKGKAFDGILTEIARLYAENAAAAQEISEPKLQKQMRYMFLDLLQILESNGISIMESKTEDKRNAKFCQVAERVPTDDPDLHDTVAKSVRVGFYIENRPLIKEMIHVYVYDKPVKSDDVHEKVDDIPENDISANPRSVTSGSQ